MTVLHWSRISDIVGRKPVILTGLSGLSLSMYCFGLSRTYWSAVIRYGALLRILWHMQALLTLQYSRSLNGT